MKLTIVAIVKNECDYLLEWIAYHRVVLKADIIIGDNVSDDGTSELLEALDQAGVIKRVFAPRVGDSGPQAIFYNKVLSEYGQDYDLMAFLDADEFLVGTGGKNIIDVLSDFYHEDEFGAMGINWRCFGSSGLVFAEKGLVIDRFLKCSKDDYINNLHIKTILKPVAVMRMNIHECVLKDGYSYCDSGVSFQMFPGGERFGPKTISVCNENLRVHHYVVKSKQEHIVKKVDKGSGAGSANRKKGKDYFNAHDFNDLVCLDAKRFSSSIEMEIEAIKERLLSFSPYITFGSGHVDISPGSISGWVNSEFDGDLFVSVSFGTYERIVPVNREREDVVRKGLSSRSRCGFLVSNLPNEFDVVSVRIYGTKNYLAMSLI